jgi:type VI secretion system protein ImpF
MAEALRDRLIPSLLDRLIDDAPEKKAELREARVLSISQLRNCVLRDLAWLLNAVHLEAVSDLEPYPEIRRSVLNYGLPSLSGRVATGFSIKDTERAIRQAIIDFEPRLIPDSVSIKSDSDTKKLDMHNVVSFRIEAQLWAQPAPVELTLHTDMDLESGQCKVTESGSTR